MDLRGRKIHSGRKDFDATPPPLAEALLVDKPAGQELHRGNAWRVTEKTLIPNPSMTSQLEILEITSPHLFPLGREGGRSLQFPRWAGPFSGAGTGFGPPGVLLLDKAEAQRFVSTERTEVTERPTPTEPSGVTPRGVLPALIKVSSVFDQTDCICSG